MRRHLLALAVVLFALPAGAAELVLRTLAVTPVRMSEASPGWAAQVRFVLVGPVAEDTEAVVTFEKLPTLRQKIAALEEGESRTVDLNGLNEALCTEAGTFPFTISLEGGTQAKLISGKLTVGREGPRDWTPREDWRLSLAAVGFDTAADEDAPRLQVEIWTTGEAAGDTFGAELLLDDKRVASSDERGQVDVRGWETVQNASGKTAYRRVTAELELVRGWLRARYQNEADWMRLDKQGGRFQLVLFRNDKPTHRVRFEVKDGRLVPTGAVLRDAKGSPWMYAPVEILDGNAGKAGDGMLYSTGIDPWKKPADLEIIYRKPKK